MNFLLLVFIVLGTAKHSFPISFNQQTFIMFLLVSKQGPGDKDMIVLRHQVVYSLPIKEDMCTTK